MLITEVNVDNNGLSSVSFEDFAPDLYVVDNTVKWSVFGTLDWNGQFRVGSIDLGRGGLGKELMIFCKMPQWWTLKDSKTVQSQPSIIDDGFIRWWEACGFFQIQRTPVSTNASLMTGLVAYVHAVVGLLLFKTGDSATVVQYVIDRG